MRYRASRLAAIAAAPLLALTSIASAGGQTVGLFVNEPAASPGYTLFNALSGRRTYLMDIDGRVVRTWDSAYVVGNAQYLLEDGSLMRCGDPRNNSTFFAGGDAGVVERFDWDGTLQWQFFYTDSTVRAHHDIAVLPNGNVLILAWERRTAAEAIQAGRVPANAPSLLWPEHVVEVEPDGSSGGNIVWEWHLWDHLVQDFDPTKDNFGVVADHPELVDINYGGSDSDWQHANAIDYNAELDQLLISVRDFDEFWVIDHATTTAEAAGPAGDLLYRWGNPQSYQRGTLGDKQLFDNHNVQWIRPGNPGAGNILIFNNGVGRPEGAYTTVDEIVPPVLPDGTYSIDPGVAYGPAAPLSSFIANPPTSFYAGFIGGAQRLPNGNTLACEGPEGDFFEFTPSGDIVWRYVSPVTGAGPLTQGDQPNGTAAFRAERYPPDFPGFKGRDLTPGGLIEIYPSDIDGDGLVTFADLVVLLSDWGTCPGCPADIDGDGIVGFDDLVILLSQWS